MAITRRFATEDYVNQKVSEIEIPEMDLSDYYTKTETDDTIQTAIEGIKTPDMSGYQEKLVSGQNIKTINGESILGDGNITVTGEIVPIEKITEHQALYRFTSSPTGKGILTTAKNEYSPFLPKSVGYNLIQGKRLTKVGIDVATAGKLSFGTAVSDTASLFVRKLFTVTTAITGYQEFDLTDANNSAINWADSEAGNVVVGQNEFIQFALPTDTMAFNYWSGVGTQTNYYSSLYRSGDPQNSNNHLNIAVFYEETEYEIPGGTLVSTYQGKHLSILGDSISTFEGYIPSGNVAYYSGSNAGVSSVEDTWWKKTINALGMTLLVNNSWSGSTVSATSLTDSKGACATRCQSLHSGTLNPDVIIVYMGINDFNLQVAQGTWNGKSAVPTDTTTFREAYAIMLDRMITKYPLAEIWVGTLCSKERKSPYGFPSQNADNVFLSEWNEAIREIARAFNVKVIEIAECGMKYHNMDTYMGDFTDKGDYVQGLHPNAAGHSLMANEVIRTLDPAVRTRY
jgi:lysophospholipase L1-like esterase